MALQRRSTTAAGSSPSVCSPRSSSRSPRRSRFPCGCCNRHYDPALADSLDKLDRYRASPARGPQIARQLEAMRARTPRKFFLRSGAAALSAAEAQEAVRALVEPSGGRLITMQAPVSKEEGRYRQVSVNVQLTANIFALRKILNAIENNTPYLFVDNFMVRTQVPGNFKPRARRGAGDVRAVRRLRIRAHGGVMRLLRAPSARRRALRAASCCWWSRSAWRRASARACAVRIPGRRIAAGRPLRGEAAAAPSPRRRPSSSTPRLPRARSSPRRAGPRPRRRQPRHVQARAVRPAGRDDRGRHAHRAAAGEGDRPHPSRREGQRDQRREGIARSDRSP